MENVSAKFITSVASADRFYSDGRPIIAVSGKSNVGKSSLINMLANNKKLAKTSDTPGRTRLINYFDFGAFVLADLPGYGFAKHKGYPTKAHIEALSRLGPCPEHRRSFAPVQAFLAFC